MMLGSWGMQEENHVPAICGCLIICCDDTNCILFGLIDVLFLHSAELEGQFLTCTVRYFNLTLVIREPLFMTMIASLILSL